VTPQLSPGRERFARTVAVVAILYATYWIVWRWTATINTDPTAVVPSLLLLVAESWAYLGLLLFVFTVWRLKDRDPGEAPPRRSVDVFITCYDEPLEILRRTAIGARAIRYPHRTYILDDGKRDEVLALCQELGVGYIRRVGNEHAKSGNLNYALSVTSGEFILQLDADHVPLPNILDRLLGYFKDERVAVVQSPQDFYNTDSFTHVVHDDGRRMWEENRLFYSLIQPGRDNHNASFFCGSCGMLRRSALEEIGGFSTQTIIEDMETTIQLHRRGWASVYHAETLAYGLAPHSAVAYHVQRLRWGQGAMQLLRKMNPLRLSGLTWAQRVHYFGGVVTYFEGWQKAIFYSMPLIFLFTGILPVAVDEREFLVRLVPYLVLAIATFELLSRGTGYILLSERYTMVRFFTYMLTITGLLSRRPLKFNVTPKGRTGVPFTTYAPQLTLLALTLLAPLWAFLAVQQGWIHYQVAGWGSTAFVVNGFWLAWNGYFAYWVVRHSLAMRQERSDHRFIDHLAVQVRVEGAEEPATLTGLTADLNPTGTAFRSTGRLDPGAEVSIRLSLATGTVWARGNVRYVTEQPTRVGRVYTHGVEFGELGVEVRDAIELHCAHHAMPLWHKRYRQSVDIMSRATEVLRNLRSEPRRVVRLPAQIAVQAEERTEPRVLDLLILEEISRSGARLVGDYLIEPGTWVAFEVPGTGIRGAGTVRYARALETSMAVHFAMGVELVDPEQSGLPAQLAARAADDAQALTAGDLAAD
jgi:cellulose synthase (UDP-forming)